MDKPESDTAETDSVKDTPRADDETSTTAPARGVTLGATIGDAAARKVFDVDTIDARLHLLCRQQVSGLRRHRPRIIARLHTNDVTVDWKQLILDLARWGKARDQVAKRWLQDYHRTYDTVSETISATKKSESEDKCSARPVVVNIVSAWAEPAFGSRTSISTRKDSRRIRNLLERNTFRTLSLEHYDGTDDDRVKVGTVIAPREWISLR
ncbi:type I-E CRISPR-associated protein Cse2/CasB [Nocardia tengchongensis]|uniref:type I-E CRISPR-associated protein Cse2/CasB n=1 Tax=Nocardia tengchongensis TaxID=2055889 RepID=UPI0033CA616C